MVNDGVRSRDSTSQGSTPTMAGPDGYGTILREVCWDSTVRA